MSASRATTTAFASSTGRRSSGTTTSWSSPPTASSPNTRGSRFGWRDSEVVTPHEVTGREPARYRREVVVHQLIGERGGHGNLLRHSERGQDRREAHGSDRGATTGHRNDPRSRHDAAVGRVQRPARHVA